MNITVIGAGKSGMAAAKLAVSKGHNVFLSELNPIGKYSEEISSLETLGIEYEFGKNSDDALQSCQLIVTSPGVPPDSNILIRAESMGIEILSEIEFAYSYLTNRIIAVTGTNGKTTTTALISYIMNNSGLEAIPCGNIGTPLSSLVNDINSDTVLIVEVSSFQLDRIKNFSPEVALILNITPDHLYYHKSMENYIKAKFKISSNQNEKNFLFLNNDDVITKQHNSNTKASTAWFSMKPVARGIYSDQGVLRIRLDEQQNWEEVMHIEEIRLPGVHNCYNSMAAALAARAFEIKNEDIRDSLMAFSGVEHRLEYVRNINGIEYFNDSKATNVNATWFALSSFSKPIIWIAGGRGDSNDYSVLDSVVENKIKSIISIGEEADNIFNHFCTKTNCYRENSLESAVIKASELAIEGDIILFTPACKSFDMFINFEHRGEVFKDIVNSL